MAKIFKLPDIGEGLVEAEIVRWLVPVGSAVGMDQPIVEVETDKAVVEIPSPFAGVVLHHGGLEGEVVEVGSVLVVIGDEGEVWTDSDAGSGDAAPIVGSISEDATTLTALGSSGPQLFSRRVAALPVVRKLARDLGVDLEGVNPTGADGKITRDDVMAAAAEIKRDRVPEPSPTEVSPAEISPGELGTSEDPAPESPVVETDRAPAPIEKVDDRVELVSVDELETVEESQVQGTHRKLSRIRRTIAANMSRSWAEIPHVTTFDSVDATRLLASKKALSGRHGTPVSLDALVVKAVLPALQSHPELAARLDGIEMVLPETIDIGVAVDTDEGLMVVVVRDPAHMSLIELSDAIRTLAERAKNRSAGPGDLTGQDFTVSNIGAVGGGFGTPIVPPGTTAILSVGRAKEQAVVRNGVIEVAPLLPLSLSYDHRLIDGGKGRRFMAMVIENLEEPTLFMA